MTIFGLILSIIISSFLTETAAVPVARTKIRPRSAVLATEYEQVARPSVKLPLPVKEGLNCSNSRASSAQALAAPKAPAESPTTPAERALARPERRPLLPIVVRTARQISTIVKVM